MVLKSTNRIVFYLLLLVAITAIVLSPSVNNDFVNFDDHVYVLKNEIITNTTSDGIKTIFDRHKPVAGNYHPLTILSYALEYKFFKLTAERYHLNSLLLHLINVLLIFWLIYLLAGNLNVAFITALLFGIHPMHVESVAWISSRKDLLYTLFFLLSMIFYLKYFFRNNLTEPIKQNRYLYLILSIIAFVLALLSKAQAVMLPIILILIDIFLRRKISIRSLLEKVPFLIASIWFGRIAMDVQALIGATDYANNFSFFDKIFIASHGFTFYRVKMFVPLKLSVFYPYPVESGPLPFLYYLTILVPLSLGFILLRYLSKLRILFFGLTFYLITIFLVLQLIPVGYAVTADRYTYLPYLGLFFIVGMLFKNIHAKEIYSIGFMKIKGSMAIGLIVVYATAMSVISFNRCNVWDDSVSLWTDVIKNYPKVARAFNNRGVHFLDNENFTPALADFDEAIRLFPEYENAHYNRGSAYFQLEDYDKALPSFSKSIELKANNVKALINRGLIYTYAARFEPALADFNKAAEISPNNILVFLNRGYSLFSMGRHNEALNDFNRCIQLNPNLAVAYNNRSRTYNMLGQFQKALTDALRARSLGYSVAEEYIQSLKSKVNR